MNKNNSNKTTSSLDLKPTESGVSVQLPNSDAKVKADFESILAPPVQKEKGKKKTLRPTSDMLKALDLKPGRNQIVYSVNAGIQGEQTVEGYIYLWPSTAKIVISDVDGTITK